jgi:major vault protein
MADDRRERDMVLAPNEFLYVSDETKGHVDVFVGPTKQSLSGTDQPVIFDARSKRFIKVELQKAIQVNTIAPEGWYVVLKNPAQGDKHPIGMGKMSSAELLVGRKVNIPGPVQFALWPGQMAKVLKGHHLRSNQYLLVRVYDEEAARDNITHAVIKPADVVKEETSSVVSGDLTMGKLLIIKGTDVSFYIPPTGIEVVPDDPSDPKSLVRNAVTLERLEYCLLMDENGNKRYEIGPKVVFPEPTEVFVETAVTNANGSSKKARKFRAIELSPNSGVYVKVIADYVDAQGSHKVGDELFITGKDTMIYFPREEHAIIKYDNNDVHFGIAIPPGEARYVLDRDEGTVELVCGPTVFLPDPRKQVIVRRPLDFKNCSLLFPGNDEAVAHNAGLLGMDVATYRKIAPVTMVALSSPTERMAMHHRSLMKSADSIGAAAYSMSFAMEDSLEGHGLSNAVSDEHAGDAIQRKTRLTAPRTLVLSTKYDGAISVNIWTGFAMMLVRKSGERRVEIGPKTVLLHYDESPQAMELSRGKPKSTNNLLSTVYLKLNANKVSDVVEVETADFCRFEVAIAYRISFEGDDPRRWFNVDNYVKYLCDHMRSRIRAAVQRVGVEEFYHQHTEIIRKIVLGESTENNLDDKTPNFFPENAMRVYDVEVLGLVLKNKEVERLLMQAQMDVIQNTVQLATKRQNFRFVEESEAIDTSINRVRSATRMNTLELRMSEASSLYEEQLDQLSKQAKINKDNGANELARARINQEVNSVNLEIRKAETDLTFAETRNKQDLMIVGLDAQVKAVAERARAITPNLVAALSAFSKRSMVAEMSKAMAPLAILGKGDGSVIGIIKRLLDGTPLAKQLQGTNLDDEYDNEA